MAAAKTHYPVANNAGAYMIRVLADFQPSEVEFAIGKDASNVISTMTYKGDNHVVLTKESDIKDRSLVLVYRGMVKANEVQYMRCLLPGVWFACKAKQRTIAHINEKGTAFVALMADPNDQTNVAKLRTVLFIDADCGSVAQKPTRWSDTLDPSTLVVTGDTSMLVENRYQPLKPDVPPAVQYLSNTTLTIARSLATLVVNFPTFIQDFKPEKAYEKAYDAISRRTFWCKRGSNPYECYIIVLAPRNLSHPRCVNGGTTQKQLLPGGSPCTRRPTWPVS